MYLVRSLVWAVAGEEEQNQVGLSDSVKGKFGLSSMGVILVGSTDFISLWSSLSLVLVIECPPLTRASMPDHLGMLVMLLLCS